MLARELGADTAFDVDRTYRLEEGGFTARWDAVAAAITPMNRVIVAWPRVPSTRQQTLLDGDPRQLGG